MPIIKPTDGLSSIDKTKKTIFLAGTIKMSKAIKWQKWCEDALAEKYNILNPRVESWDDSWEQSIDNQAFKDHVIWELEALEMADEIIMYIDPTSQSPISLLEFGLYAKSGKMKVVCPEGFWRKGNVDVVCEIYDIPQFNSIDALLKTMM